MELVVLGSAGGPQPHAHRGAPGFAVIHHNAVHLVDAGEGTVARLAQAGLRLQDLRAIYLTHHHIDHNADLGNAVALAWTTRHSQPIDVYGPPGLARHLDLFLQMQEPDIAARGRARAPITDSFRAHDLPVGPQEVSVDGLRVRTAAVTHPPMEALGYRLETEAGVIAFSGDTAQDEAVADLARGADVLVHEAFSPEHMHLLAAGSSAPEADLRDHFGRGHTTAEQAGEIAERAGVRTLVLAHLIPGEGVRDEEWAEQAQRTFSGDVVVASDLLRLPVRPVAATDSGPALT